MPRGSPQTDRLIETISFVANRPNIGANATDIARHLGVDRATCYPMLRQLCHYGWLIRDAHSKRYVLGPSLIAVGTHAARALDLLDVARPAMTQLADDTDLATVLVSASADELIVVEIAQPRTGERPTLGLRVADTFPFRAPLGAVLVAWEDEARRAQWLAGLDAQREGLVRSLASVRRRGFAVEALEGMRDLQHEVDARRAGATTGRDLRDSLRDIAQDLGTDLLLDDLRTLTNARVLTLSAPIFAADHHAAAALCFYDPPTSLTPAQIANLGRRLIQTAAIVSRRLGGPSVS